jgi:hypothetical protein
MRRKTALTDGLVQCNKGQNLIQILIQKEIFYMEISLIITKLNPLVSALAIYTCSPPDTLHKAPTRTQNTLPTEKQLEGGNMLKKHFENNFEISHSAHSHIIKTLSNFVNKANLVHSFS